MPHSDFPEHFDRRSRPLRSGPPPRRGGGKWVVAGVVVACTLGIVGGMALRPTAEDAPPPLDDGPRRVVEIPREPLGLGIVVDQGPPPEMAAELPPAPAPSPIEDMEDFAPAPPQQRERQERQERQQARQTGERPQPRSPAPSAQPRPDAPPPPVVVAEAPQMRPFRPAARQEPREPPPVVNCRRARSTAERLVCIDPRLAAADQTLARAYGDAQRAGVPEAVLRGQQRVWMNARNAAARHGPEDLARVYDARIDELRRMAR